MHIVTLATCHNRRVKTLSALSDLHAQELPQSVTVEHVIVDDGSTDGTTKAVEEQFPNVEIVHGTGALLWAGGMRFGWVHSVSNKEFDFLFVYNDDVRLAKKAIQGLVNTSLQFVCDGGVTQHIIVGAFYSKETHEVSYSGLVKNSRWHPLRFKKISPLEMNYRIVDTLNMNSALINREVLNDFGFLSESFAHGGADFDYGLTVVKGGGYIILGSGYAGTCEPNHDQADYIADAKSLGHSYRLLLSPKKQPFKQRMAYYAQHGGILWVFFWLLPYVTLPFKYWVMKARRLSKLIIQSPVKTPIK